MKIEELNQKLANLIAQQERASAIGRTTKAANLSKDIAQLRSRIKSIQIIGLES
ncbi:MAG: hypothetical protein ACRCZS_02430 [Chroococcidiopsis sp.]